jgi:hypothetical protein
MRAKTTDRRRTDRTRVHRRRDTEMPPKADRTPWFQGRACDPERGDVPGWVLVTLMTAGLVVALWAVAGPLLEGDRPVDGPILDAFELCGGDLTCRVPLSSLQQLRGSEEAPDYIGAGGEHTPSLTPRPVRTLSPHERADPSFSA